MKKSIKKIISNKKRPPSTYSVTEIKEIENRLDEISINLSSYNIELKDIKTELDSIEKSFRSKEIEIFGDGWRFIESTLLDAISFEQTLNTELIIPFDHISTNEIRDTPDNAEDVIKLKKSIIRVFKQFRIEMYEKRKILKPQLIELHSNRLGLKEDTHIKSSYEDALNFIRFKFDDKTNKLWVIANKSDDTQVELLANHVMNISGYTKKAKKNEFDFTYYIKSLKDGKYKFQIIDENENRVHDGEFEIRPSQKKK